MRSFGQFLFLFLFYRVIVSHSVIGQKKHVPLGELCFFHSDQFISMMSSQKNKINAITRLEEKCKNYCTSLRW